MDFQTRYVPLIVVSTPRLVLIFLNAQFSGHKLITGNTLVRMGLAWSKKVLRSSEKVNDLWAMYSTDTLTTKSTNFHVILHRKGRDSVYHAVAYMAGHSVAQMLVKNGSISSPSSLQAPPTSFQKRKAHDGNASDEEVDQYLRSKPRPRVTPDDQEVIDLDN